MRKKKKRNSAEIMRNSAEMMQNSADHSMFFLWKFCPIDDFRYILPPSQNLLKSRFPDKIFDNSVFLIWSRAPAALVHSNSTRRIFLNRSQGFLTSFLGVKADWKSYFENYKKKGARSSAPDRWILCKIGRGIVWEGSWTPKTAKKIENSKKNKEIGKIPKFKFSNVL